MLTFCLFALLINATPVALFGVARHQVARWPLPGLWWLALVTLAIVLTPLLAEQLL